MGVANCCTGYVVLPIHVGAFAPGPATHVTFSVTVTVLLMVTSATPLPLNVTTNGSFVTSPAPPDAVNVNTVVVSAPDSEVSDHAPVTPDGNPVTAGVTVSV